MSNFDCHVKEDLNEEDAKERERKRERWRKACGGPPEYVHNQNRYCVLHYPGEDKEAAFKKKRDSKLAQQDYDFRGAVFPISASSFEKRPFDADVKFAGATFHGEADFRKATFRREADFSEANFAGEARFRAATFKGKGDFAKANFEKEAGFRNVTFEKEASFAKTVFKEEAKFRRTIFQGFVEFTAPSKKDPCETHTFNKRANFSAAKFEERAIFLGQCTFDTHQQEATFRNALIEKPENFSFDRVRLRPSWFIDTNVQQLRFTYVQWRGLPGGPPGSIEEEIKAVKNRRSRKGKEEDSQSGYPPDVLAKTCRELSANAEDNREYPLANEFHYWSMEALRKGRWASLIWIKKHWLRVARCCGLVTTLRWVWCVITRGRLGHPRSRFGIIPTLYWILNGYGVRAARAFMVLVGIWAFFAILYMVAGHQQLQVFSASEVRHFAMYLLTSSPYYSGLGAPSLSEIEHAWADIRPALVYSLGALARLRPEPLPDGPSAFQFLVTAEGILGPLQIALLALAIRRKVMR